MKVYRDSTYRLYVPTHQEPRFLVELTQEEAKAIVDWIAHAEAYGIVTEPEVDDLNQCCVEICAAISTEGGS